MDWCCLWRQITTALIITMTSVDETKSDCPSEYWDDPSKRCAYPLVSALEQLRLDETWTSAVGVNKTCLSWQQTSVCYKQLMKQCNGDRGAVQELRMHAGRYWIYSLTCSDHNVRHRQMLVDCFLPHMKPTRTCTEAFDTYFRNFVLEKQYRNACRVVNTAMKCFHDIKTEINQRCSSVGSSEYHRNYIQPLVDQTRDTVLAHCTLSPPFEEYFNKAPSILRHGDKHLQCCLLLSFAIAALSVSSFLASGVRVLIVPSIDIVWRCKVNVR